MPCQAPCEAASGVRLRAGTLSTPSTDISTSRIQTGAPGAMRMARASSWARRRRTRPAPSAHLAQSGGQGARTEQPVALGGGGRRAGQPAGGERRAECCGKDHGCVLCQEPRPGPCGVMPQAGRRRAGQWRPWKSTHLQAHVRAWALFAPRGRWLYRARLGPRRRRGGVRTGARAFPDQVITLERAAQARQTSRVTILINKPVGYVSGQAEKGYTPAVALIDARSRFAADRAPQRFERGHLDGLAVAGRLDIDSRACWC